MKKCQQSSCFSAIFDAPDPYENYPNKISYKKAFWLHPEAGTSMIND